jgi:hypothetical protein
MKHCGLRIARGGAFLLPSPRVQPARAAPTANGQVPRAAGPPVAQGAAPGAAHVTRRCPARLVPGSQQTTTTRNKKKQEGKKKRMGKEKCYRPLRSCESGLQWVSPFCFLLLIFPFSFFSFSFSFFFLFSFQRIVDCGVGGNLALTSQGLHGDGRMERVPYASFYFLFGRLMQLEHRLGPRLRPRADPLLRSGTKARQSPSHLAASFHLPMHSAWNFACFIAAGRAPPFRAGSSGTNQVATCLS